VLLSDCSLEGGPFGDLDLNSDSVNGFAFY